MTALLYVRRKLSRGAACYMLHARRIWPGPFEHVRLLCARSLSARGATGHGGFTPAGGLPGAQPRICYDRRISPGALCTCMAALRPQDICPGRCRS